MTATTERPTRTHVGRLGDLLSESTLATVAGWIADDEPDRSLAVVVTDEDGAYLGIVRVEVEGTGDDGHDAIHAIIAGADAVAARGLDWPDGYAYAHAGGAPDAVEVEHNDATRSTPDRIGDGTEVTDANGRIWRYRALGDVWVRLGLDGAASPDSARSWLRLLADRGPLVEERAEPEAEPEVEPVADGGVIRCHDAGCPGSLGRGLPPADHSCAFGRGLYPTQPEG